MRFLRITSALHASGYGISIMAASILAGSRDSLLTLYPHKWDEESYKWQEKEELPEIYHLHIYPNPTSGNLSIESDRPARLEIYSFNGQRVIEQQIRKGSNDVQFTQWPDGVYLCKFTFADGSFEVQRIVKTK